MTELVRNFLLDILEIDDDHSAWFYQAFVKARGDGVGFPFKECEFHLPDGCQGQHSILYIGGVAQNR